MPAVLNAKGFTLIELLIVVAVIAILASIAIPQYQVYRIRGFNAAANADLKNAKAVEESMFSTDNTYGRTQGTAATPILLGGATGGAGPGAASIGPVAAATGTVLGALITGPTINGGISSQGIGVSSGVTLVADSLPLVPPANTSLSYTVYSKHQQGNRVFVTEAETTSIFFVQREPHGFIGVPLSPGGSPATGIACTAIQDVTSLTPGNGNPNVNWASL